MLWIEFLPASLNQCQKIGFDWRLGSASRVWLTGGCSVACWLGDGKSKPLSAYRALAGTFICGLWRLRFSSRMLRSLCKLVTLDLHQSQEVCDSRWGLRMWRRCLCLILHVFFSFTTLVFKSSVASLLAISGVIFWRVNPKVKQLRNKVNNILGNFLKP